MNTKTRWFVKTEASKNIKKWSNSRLLSFCSLRAFVAICLCFPAASGRSPHNLSDRVQLGPLLKQIRINGGCSFLGPMDPVGSPNRAPQLPKHKKALWWRAKQIVSAQSPHAFWGQEAVKHNCADCCVCHLEKEGAVSASFLFSSIITLSL